MKLGWRQLAELSMCASPATLLLTPDKVTRSLVARGLMRQREKDKGAACITAAGLRTLANAMDAGVLDDALEHWRKEVEARQGRLKAKRGGK